MGLVAREFMDDARQTAYVLGMPDLAIIEMPRGLTNLTPGEVLEIAASLKPQVLAALTSDGRRASQQRPAAVAKSGLAHLHRQGSAGCVWPRSRPISWIAALATGFPCCLLRAEAVEEMLSGNVMGAGPAGSCARARAREHNRREGCHQRRDGRLPAGASAGGARRDRSHRGSRLLPAGHGHVDRSARAAAGSVTARSRAGSA